MKPPVALSIAGSDPSGGAGIQADLKTFHQFGVYGEAVIALITVQNTVSVEEVKLLNGALVSAQLRAVLADLPPAAIKTGALGGRGIVEAVAFTLADLAPPLVVDPVMISKHGAPLMDGEAREAIVRLLLPAAALLTPNLHEASAISGRPVTNTAQMRDAALAILNLGPAAVLIKGGHLEGEATDILLTSGGFHEFPAPRIDSPHTHGTGCSYSAAITALLAHGLPLVEAVTQARWWIHEAIATNPGLGRGNGPINHFANPSPFNNGN